MANPPYHTAKRRKVLLAGMDLAALTGIEIGPLDDPLALKSKGPVIYVDHVSRDQLVAKYAKNPAVNTPDIVEVDVVWGGQPLADLIGTSAADYVIASHVAEHIPDLVGWLIDLQKVLKPGGQLMLILPDKRMSYDAPRRETNLIDVLDAFVRQAKVPQVYQLLDCALGIVQTNAYEMHTTGAHFSAFPAIHTIDSALQLARHAFQHAELYIDIHCWAFTPKSFSDLLYDLNKYDLVRYACHEVIETDADSNWEFAIKLKAGGDRGDALESWRLAGTEALPYIRGSLDAQRYAVKPDETPDDLVEAATTASRKHGLS